MSTFETFLINVAAGACLSSATSCSMLDRFVYGHASRKSSEASRWP
jgi:hypothetical protein